MEEKEAEEELRNEFLSGSSRRGAFKRLKSRFKGRKERRGGGKTSLKDGWVKKE